ncbi:MAG: diacylglycerol O-acyltransferase / wax synthase, partial [Pseudonocardiales bacterium]|nr:diacylglycerol O-acyltransferase / wax synthase [Pseudonocardiales bacterium]
MTNPDRLTGLDASFLALEDAGAHMHVGSCMLFEGEAPDYEDFVAQVDSRLHLVPRYRQKLAFPPLTQARPVWVDDPHFNPGYHVRHTALPEPASLEQLRNLTG